MIDTSTPIQEKEISEKHLREFGSERREKEKPGSRYVGKKVWIDIDNSPHIPFFLPIIDELKVRGVEVVLTARDIYQVCELLKFFQLPCKVIGRHYGKNKFLKVFGSFLRVVQLGPTAVGSRPNLAVSHGSRAQLLICKMMRIPTMMLHDYEHSTKTGFIEPDWLLMPDMIPLGAMSRNTERVLQYPGLKEDVYVPRFKPDPSILKQLGIAADELIVTVRPPASEAHYHNPESDVLFAETMRYLASIPKVRAVTLPRNGRQKEQLRAEWNEFLADGRMIIPDFPVDGLNLIWFSELVVSGGGTMNREAAALGVPVYSTFRGKIGAVDHYLAEHGRMTLIENVQEVHNKIKVCRWKRPAKPDGCRRPALDYILNCILSLLAAEDPRRVTQAEMSLRSQPRVAAAGSVQSFDSRQMA
jgi:predicted glycosyltransferase